MKRQEFMIHRQQTRAADDYRDQKMCKRSFLIDYFKNEPRKLNEFSMTETEVDLNIFLCNIRSRNQVGNTLVTLTMIS